MRGRHDVEVAVKHFRQPISTHVMIPIHHHMFVEVCPNSFMFNGFRFILIRTMMKAANADDHVFNFGDCSPTILRPVKNDPIR